MRVVFVLLLAAVCALAVPVTKTQYKVADKDFLEKQKEILRLFYHVGQPSYYKDIDEVADAFKFEGNWAQWVKPEYAKEFYHYYENDILPQGEVFSVFYPEHLKQAIALFRTFYYAKDWETFYKVACWARQNVNEGMYVYALSVATVHSKYTQDIVLPPIYEIYPHYFFNDEVIYKAQQYKQHYWGVYEHEHEYKDADYKGYTIPANYSGWYVNVHPEQSMTYFTEDIGVNSYYYYRHIFMPFWMSNDEISYDASNRGEYYLWANQQLLARYYLERLSNGFGEIPHFEYEYPIETGYYPSLTYANGLKFPTRPSHANLYYHGVHGQQSYPHYGNYTYSYTYVKDYERRLRDALDRGYIFTQDGKIVRLFDEDGLETLGRLIESNADSPNGRYYGDLMIFSRHLLGYSFYPLDQYKAVPSALEHYETSLRDPMFWSKMQQAGTKKSSQAKSINNKAGIASLIIFVVLLLAWIAGFSSRLFAVIRFESIIHEFDPWFNYRATAYMVKHGFYNFLNWFDERAWYPLGRIVGGTVYPGLMITSGSIHYVLHLLHINVHIRDICVFLAPIFSGLTAISTYLLTKELWSAGAGLFAACFIAIVPGYISRSVAGSYDNEGIAIFALQFTYYLWIKSVKTGSVFWSVMSALSYFYMVSAWGGYVFIINLIPLHVFVLLVMGRFSNRLFTSYTTFYILGLLLSMQIPFVGFQPIRTSEHMAASGVFALMIAVATLRYLQTVLSKAEFKSLFIFGGAIAAGVVFLTVVLLTYAGYIAPWSGRFYSLWDTGYAKIHIPIIASVSEHQPTTWFSFFFDLHVLVTTFPAGLWYCIKNINDERVFVVLYALSAVYFAGVMVRLMLTLTPVVCILSGVAFSGLLDHFLREDEMSTRTEDSGDKDDDNSTNKRYYDKAGRVTKLRHEQQRETDVIGPNLRSIVIVVVTLLLMLFAVHCTWVTSNAYSSPSIVLASYSGDGTRQILDDFREAYFWLSQNTADEARVMSWWDYGYQIAGMANRTTLVDNNTWNNSHIALVGKAMSSNESAAYEIMTALDVDYVLVIFGGVIGYSGDDINKFLWMVRIAEGEHPKDIRESDYFTEHGEFRVDAEGSPTLLNCLMYKLSYYRFGELKLDYRSPAGFDRTRNAVIGNRDFQLTYLEEAYTTEHWLVRIYRVKKPDEFNRPRIPVANRIVKSGSFVSKKNSKRRKGTIKNKPVIVKGKRPTKQAV